MRKAGRPEKDVFLTFPAFLFSSSFRFESLPLGKPPSRVKIEIGQNRAALIDEAT
jgi:hypothetical protein